MATTKVGTDRKPLQALEKYPDAAFVTDDLPLYFGTDGDAKVQFSAADTKVIYSGADFRFSDTTKLEFGDSGDATINWNGSTLVVTGGITYSGGDIRMSDSAQLIFGSTSGSDVEMFYHNATNSDCLRITGLTAKKTVPGCIYASDGFLKIVS